MKTKKQLEFSYKMTATGIVAVAVIVIAVLATSNNKHKECSDELPVDECVRDSVYYPTENDVLVLDTMLNQVQDIEKDLDTLHIRMNRIEDKIDDMLEEQKTSWHGREGRSEYGEYEAYSEWMEMQ